LDDGEGDDDDSDDGDGECNDAALCLITVEYSQTSSERKQ